MEVFVFTRGEGASRWYAEEQQCRVVRKGAKRTAVLTIEVGE